MRNIGLFLPQRVEPSVLEHLLVQKGGVVEMYHEIGERRTVAIGADQTWVYINTDTSLADVFYDDESFEKAKAELGFEPRGYIDLHFSLASAAFDLAENFALEMQTLWGGVIDYDGAGGGIGKPPKSRMRPGAP